MSNNDKVNIINKFRVKHGNFTEMISVLFDLVQLIKHFSEKRAISMISRKLQNIITLSELITH